MSNENCLAGMSCPECKSEGPFKIQITAYVTVHDDGTDDVEDVAWENSSECRGLSCSYRATIEDFTDKGEKALDIQRDAGGIANVFTVKTKRGKPVEINLEITEEGDSI